ncbi:MAG: CHASE2 domain-containing protein, partial [Zetaproteobacteria bacterium]
MVERLLRFLDKHQRWFGWPLIVGASLFSLLLALAKPTIIEQIELKTLDERFRLRGPMLAPKNVVIVAIDDESIAKLGRWPWPRATMARLIEALFARYHARAVGLDIVFSEASRNPLHESAEIAKKMDAPAELLAWLRAHTEKADPDAALAQVAHRYRDRLVLGYFFYPDPRKAPAIVRAHFDQEAKKLKTSAMSVRIEGGKRLIGPPEMRAIEGNIAPLASSGAAQGFFNFFPDSDGMVRRVPLVARIGDVGYPNLDLQLLRAGMGWPEAIVRAGPAGVDGIQIANHRIPTDETGKMLLNHYGPRGSFAHVPAWR